mmetsp:Transcript_61255/g.176354  ORF Transcript_61255/g.176354 Transcript_61255/m.176354 type:complete len:218 (-) Transcript_61255:129-782(-)
MRPWSSTPSLRSAPPSLRSTQERPWTVGHSGVSGLSAGRAGELGGKSWEYRRNFEDAYEDLARQRNISKLDRLFTIADSDGSGAISFGEFKKALQSQKAQVMFSGLGVQPHQAVMVFKAVDRSGDGELSRDEFLEGILRLCRPGVDGCCAGELDMRSLRAANLSKHLNVELPTQASASRKSFVSKGQVQRAFVRSAMSQALYPVAAGPPLMNRRRAK